MANPEFESQYRRKTNYGQRPYADFTGTTNATANIQTLFAHGLKDANGNPLKPSFVDITPDSGAAQVYETSANHTTTQVDIRAATVSAPFRCRVWA